MRVREIINEAQLVELREDWDNLLKQSPSRSVYMSFEWIYTWWRHFARGKLFVLVAEADGQVRCIAPLMLTRERFLGMPYTRVRFIGSDPTGTTKRNAFDKLFSIDKRYGWSDVLDFLYKAEDIESLKATLEYLKRQKGRWDILDLRELHSSTNSIGVLKSTFGGGDYLFNDVAAKVATVSLETDFETYRKSRNKNWRKNISRTYKRIGKLPRLVLGKYVAPAQVADIMPAVIDLEQKSWQGNRGVGAFSQKSAGQFHRELAELLAQRQRFVLYTLELDRRIVCYQYAFRYNNTLCLHNTAMDPDFRYYSPGFYLQLRIIEEAFSQEAQQIVLGRGWEDYKSKLKNSEEDRIWITVFAARLVPRVLGYLEFKARPMMKQLLHGSRNGDGAPQNINFANRARRQIVRLAICNHHTLKKSIDKMRSAGSKYLWLARSLS
jgi:hypothetical protein